MTKFNASILAAATAALFVTTGAMAATLQPAAGNAPFVNEPVAVTSTLTRAAVEAQAAAQRPVAGDMTIGLTARAPAHHATRAQVEAEAAQHLPAAGNTPFAS